MAKRGPFQKERGISAGEIITITGIDIDRVRGDDVRNGVIGEVVFKGRDIGTLFVDRGNGFFFLFFFFLLLYLNALSTKLNRHEVGQ